MSGKVDQSHLTMGLFTIEFVSKASAQLFPENTLSSFTIFVPEKLIPEGQREVEIFEKSHPSMYHKFMEERFIFFDKNFSKSSEIIYLEPGL